MLKFNTKHAATIGLCLTYVLLNACGTKGPLYIPEQRYPQEEGAQTAPQPANPTTTPPVKDY